MFECCEKKQAKTSKMSFSQLKVPNKKTWKNMILALLFVTTLVYLAFNKIGIIAGDTFRGLGELKYLKMSFAFLKLAAFSK